MANNESLKRAKKEKDDEFYTEYSDIEKEMNAYLEYNPNVFRDKVIFLPCDDPEWSNFTRYFAQNFELPSDTSHPVASLIKEFEELVKPESDFRKEILEIIKEKEENDLKISISENTNEENSK